MDDSACSLTITTTSSKSEISEMHDGDISDPTTKNNSVIYNDGPFYSDYQVKHSRNLSSRNSAPENLDAKPKNIENFRKCKQNSEDWDEYVDSIKKRSAFQKVSLRNMKFRSKGMGPGNMTTRGAYNTPGGLHLN